MRPLLLLAATGLVILSCQKETEHSVIKKKPQTTTASEKVVITISWTEWGRKRKDCNGGGLCHFKATVESQQQSVSDGSSTVFTDATNNSKYIMVWRNETLQQENAAMSLFIDAPIVAQSIDGSITVVAPAGQYAFNPQIGPMGGYKVPVQVTN